MKTAILLAIGLGLGRWAGAQTAPDVDIYLADLRVKQGRVQLGPPQNLTNRPGYDNQPYFLPDGQGLLYTVMENGQTDIYQYDLRSGASRPLTRTPESEYSSALMPGGQSVSVVRVEADGTQRLWQFSLADPAQAAPVLPDLKPVGYYAWQGQGRLALFVLGNPNALYVANAQTNETTQLANRVGRSFHAIPGDRDGVSFVHKLSDQQWIIKRVDLATQEIRPLVEGLPGCEDLAWTKEGIILLAKGSKIYQCQPTVSREWTEVADFAEQGLRQITRLAVDPRSKKLALVAER
jgi:hypothetical protein